MNQSQHYCLGESEAFHCSPLLIYCCFQPQGHGSKNLWSEATRRWGVEVTCWETFSTRLLGLTFSSDHGHWGHKVPNHKPPTPPFPFPPLLRLVPSRAQPYQLCQIHRRPRSGTLFLTCPSAPRGIPLMRRYREQMQRGQPGQKQPATVT